MTTPADDLYALLAEADQMCTHWDEKIPLHISLLADLATALRTQRAALAEAQQRESLLLSGAQLVLEAFESGIFCRDPKGDEQKGWALKLVGPIRGLAILQQALDAARAAREERTR